MATPVPGPCSFTRGLGARCFRWALPLRTSPCCATPTGPHHADSLVKQPEVSARHLVPNQKLSSSPLSSVWCGGQNHGSPKMSCTRSEPVTVSGEEELRGQGNRVASQLTLKQGAHPGFSRRPVSSQGSEGQKRQQEWRVRCWKDGARHPGGCEDR